MRGESMKDKSKKSTYSTTFGVDPFILREKTAPVCQKSEVYSGRDSNPYGR